MPTVQPQVVGLWTEASPCGRMWLNHEAGALTHGNVNLNNALLTKGARHKVTCSMAPSIWKTQNRGLPGDTGGLVGMKVVVNGCGVCFLGDNHVQELDRGDGLRRLNSLNFPELTTCHRLVHF